MASKTSGSTGLLVTTTVFIVLTVAGFITTVVFYGQRERATKDLQQMRDDQRDVITAGERGDERVRLLIEQAKGERKSLVTYMDETIQESMRRVTGNPNTSLAQLNLMLDGDPGDPSNSGVPGADSTSLLTIVSQQSDEIGSLQSSLASANSNLSAAQSDLQAEVERVRQLREQYDQTVSGLSSQLGEYESDVNQYRDSVTDTIDQNNTRVADIRRTAAEQEEAMQGRIAELEQENLVLSQAVESLRADQAGSNLTADNEYALVDGRVLGSNPGQNEVFINLGRNNRVVVGMTFEVYDDGTRIRPNAEGAYPPGKAAVEIIRINQGSSTARVIRQNNRNPIVEGDVIANALYDPNKTYTFVVYGNFDANRDGQATSQERGGIVGLITEWGGVVADDLSGDTDFLVLGERPVLPPEPSPDSPLPVIQDYIRKKRTVEEYDRLFRIAAQTSIPVLNQNRLYTLTGLTGAR